MNLSLSKHILALLKILRRIYFNIKNTAAVVPKTHMKIKITIFQEEFFYLTLFKIKSNIWDASRKSRKKSEINLIYKNVTVCTVQGDLK